jgi:uncharacterized membrane protein YesL
VAGSHYLLLLLLLLVVLCFAGYGTSWVHAMTAACVTAAQPCLCTTATTFLCALILLLSHAHPFCSLLSHALCCAATNPHTLRLLPAAVQCMAVLLPAAALLVRC